MSRPSARDAPLELGRVRPDHAFGSCGHVLMIHWRTGVEVEAVHAVTRYREELQARGRMNAALHIAEEGVALPSPEARSAAEASLRDPSQRALACALVVYGSGFGASAVRSVGTAIFALRAGPPTRLFGDLPDALRWLATKAEVGAPYLSLLAACQDLRAARP